MKKYIKFIIVVCAVTVAVFGSMDVKANRNDKDQEYGGCSGATGECGKTDQGKIIVGVYNT
ncbi:hypothetical protein SGQ83_11560 [Flavobacterium sp. Fl-318]|uniref:Membrane or secreted protein n=1 Tax=Flavobacterium cupriresistens TaxID=2893885 RepID=A0ABU4RBM7_9FLAO|nr:MULTISPECIES: hypothetical protein [unclassified Flavobacterium]MDX6189987.1 hypothetical protein [Flavobacterium sp. Fl-318]UFH42812.1 hypothetical protein LNP23_01010 [Flavobacterium sp. F-323]